VGLYISSRWHGRSFIKHGRNASQHGRWRQRAPINRCCQGARVCELRQRGCGTMTQGQHLSSLSPCALPNVNKEYGTTDDMIEAFITARVAMRRHHLSPTLLLPQHCNTPNQIFCGHSFCLGSLMGLCIKQFGISVSFRMWQMMFCAALVTCLYRAKDNSYI
jgi:hypothetical protein